jgi:ribonuclease HII
MKQFDNSYLSEGINHICGIDEAGRGPLAGPVVAAAVIFDEKTDIPEVNDSKKLTHNKRVKLYQAITENALSYGVGIVNNNLIDEINILQASLKAMQMAVEKLYLKPDLLLIDGNKTFTTEIPANTVVKGDSKSLSIAAASILAKVIRDEIMIKASQDYPVYHWEKNKGYATKQHIEAIRESGYSALHRKTFLGNIYQEEELRLF